jgi:aspartyl aminopeptidase
MKSSLLTTGEVDRNSADNFQFNQETQMVPILGLIADQLNEKKEATEQKQPNASSVQENHHPALLSLLADELSVAPEDIRDFELQLYDSHSATLGGLNNEFIFGPRLDNQFSS